MQLVLDLNEYLFALGAERKPACEVLLSTILEDPAAYTGSNSHAPSWKKFAATPPRSDFGISDGFETPTVTPATEPPTC